jgi:hypothetical protein
MYDYLRCRQVAVMMYVNGRLATDSLWILGGFVAEACEVEIMGSQRRFKVKNILYICLMLGY